MQLDTLRTQIDEIDTALIDLFAARMDVVTEIAAYKRGAGLPVFDPAREAEKLEALSGRVRPELLPYARELFETLFALSRRLQDAEGR